MSQLRSCRRLLLRSFWGRRDRYLLETKKAATQVEKRVTRRLLDAHLHGRMRVGLFCDPRCGVRWLRFDFDGKAPKKSPIGKARAWELVHLVVNTLVMDLHFPPPLIEPTRSGEGYAAYLFFHGPDYPTFAEVESFARGVLRAAGLADDLDDRKGHIGLRPRAPAGQSVGQTCFLPWGGLLNGGRTSLFVSLQDGEPLEDQFGMLEGAPYIERERMVAAIVGLPVTPSSGRSTADRRQTVSSNFDLTQWISAFLTLETRGPRPWLGGPRLWDLVECPSSENHSDPGDKSGAYIAELHSGAIVARCQHSSCSWNWHDLRERYEPGWTRPRTSQASSPRVEQQRSSNWNREADGEAPPGECRQAATAGLKPEDNAPEDEAHRTELGLAQRFIDKHGDDVLHCFPTKVWLVWDSRRWIEDRCGTVTEMVKKVVGELHRTARTKIETDFALACEKERVIRAAIGLARSSVSVLPEELDRDTWLLNLPNGTLDLRTGELRPHRRKDLLTKLCLTAYDPAATAPTFERFLLEIMDGDVELCGYLQRLFGYAITGTCREHILALFIGRGANGKSTLTGALQRTLGRDYAMQVAPSLLFDQKTKDSHPTGLADLQGKRLAITHELDSGTRLAEGLVKSATGGDPIKARRMRQDFFTFDPTHMLVVCANSRPVVRGVDDGIWRRLRLIPFRVQFADEQQDKGLPAKLDAEAAGILAWLADGAREWQALGLADPASVRTATAAYRDEQDTLGEFLDERCVEEEKALVLAGKLYEVYLDWHKGTAGNGDPLRQNTFGRLMTDRGHERVKTSGAWYRRGLRLR